MPLPAPGPHPWAASPPCSHLGYGPSHCPLYPVQPHRDLPCSLPASGLLPEPLPYCFLLEEREEGPCETSLHAPPFNRYLREASTVCRAK